MALRGRVAVLATASADPERDALAAWSIGHGFVTLWLAGALPPNAGPDPESAARSVIRRLFE
ncbi:WHG domain-containing protein [Micromonospora sp. NPDC047740]|uniref:WHG domain-containing protein n=1 Tax=Micromonospora sp. NPDC047740 TaxID=3364254 RepID=UPI003714BD98